jgi:nitrogen fixation protein FixH
MGTGTMVSTKPEFRLTGPKILLILFGFFGTIMAVNFVMAYYAIHTFSGMQTEKPYESGLAYNRAIAEAKAQSALGWKVDIHSEKQADGTLRLSASLKDASNLPLNDLFIHVRLLSPTDSKHDHEAVLVFDHDGVYHGSTPTEAGQWDVELIAERDGHVQFRSLNRVIVH